LEDYREMMGMVFSFKNIIRSFVIVLSITFPYVSYADDAYPTNDSGYNQQVEEPSLYQKTEKWWNQHKPWRESELRELKEELAAKEELLAKIEVGIASIVNNARPRCKNGTVTVSIDSDPRVELRNDITKLKQRIADLED